MWLFFRENDVFQCSKASSTFLESLLVHTPEESFLSVWLLRRRICTQILWKHHVTLIQIRKLNFSVNFSVKSTCFFDKFSKNCECFVSIVSDLAQKLPVFLFFSVSVLKPSIFSTKSPFAAFFHVVNRCSWKSLKLQQRKLTPSKHMAWVCSLVDMCIFCLVWKKYHTHHTVILPDWMLEKWALLVLPSSLSRD